MGAASGSQPARGDGEGVAHGVIYAPLLEVHPDRIVVGGRTIFLLDGKTCTYKPGTSLEVLYAEKNGRAEAETITPVKPTR
jgi:hypothetical protein